MSYTWNINWRSIFNNTKTETCKIRFRLISHNTNTITKDNVGSIRVSLQSNTSKISNGLNLGSISVKRDNFTQTNYLEGNTLDTDGFTMIIPKTDNSFLTLSLYDINENLLTKIPNFNIWLYFDTDE
jgi:hypothetical protein